MSKRTPSSGSTVAPETRATRLKKGQHLGLGTTWRPHLTSPAPYRVALAGCRRQQGPSWPKSPLEGIRRQAHLSLPDAGVSHPDAGFAVTAPHQARSVTACRSCGPLSGLEAGSSGAQAPPVLESMSDSADLWPLGQLCAPKQAVNLCDHIPCRNARDYARRWSGESPATRTDL